VRPPRTDPVSRRRSIVLALCLAVTVAAALFVSTRSPAALQPDPVRFWTAVGSCETGHIGLPDDGPPRWDWGARRRPREGRVYEGGVGFYWATWAAWARELGLLARYPHAYLAPPRVQIRVAEYGRRVHGGYWGCLA
jgi:hypothetical protein